MKQTKTGAVILAGGQGRRMRSRVQKQYMELDGRPLITYTLQAFEESPVDVVTLVVGCGEIEFAREEIVAPYGFSKVQFVVEGGKERYDSVYAGLLSLQECDYVLIHDGARPLVTPELITRAVKGARRHEACVVGMPVKDTIKISDEKGYACVTPDRSCLWQIQTPQAFSYPLVRDAYDRIMGQRELLEGITDDAMVVESQTDQKVKLIEGSYENMKVTTPEDLLIAGAFLQMRKKLKKS